MTKREINKRVYVSGVRPMGYVLHVDRLFGLPSEIPVHSYPAAIALVRTLRDLAYRRYNLSTMRRIAEARDV